MMVRSIMVLGSIALLGCGETNDVDSQLDSQISRRGIDVSVPAVDSEVNYHFDHMTPTGKKLFDAAQVWEKAQWSFRSTQAAQRVFATPAARMCAGNLSQVYYMTGIADFSTKYRWTAVDEIATGIKDHGGKVVNFSKDKRTLIRQLNDLYGGRIPLGSVVGGCLKMDANNNCRRIDGSRHIGMVGHTVDVGVKNGVATEIIMAYHNNWYRSENAGGGYHKFMVSKRNRAGGFPRQFMAVPWIEVDRDTMTKKIIDVRTAILNPATGVAAIDDMDPFTFNAFVAIPQEIEDEIDAGESRTTDGLGGVHPLGELDYDLISESRFCHTASDPAGTKVLVRDEVDGEAVASVQDGEKLKIISRSGDQLKVEVDGISGFVHKSQFAPCKFTR